MDQSATAPLVFAPPATLPLAVDFLGGRLTSDGGWSWVAEADVALGRWLVAAGAEPLRLETVRLQLNKIAGRVRQLPTRVHLRLASSHPGGPLWRYLAAREGRS